MIRIKKLVKANEQMALLVVILAVAIGSWAYVQKEKVVTLYIIGDSTVANYGLEDDYQEKRYPQMGWGQVFQSFFNEKGIKAAQNLIKGDSVWVDDRAKGGRSTRTFFQEGKWRAIYNSLQKDDIVMMQFGHNDAAMSKVLRYTNIEGYKEFLRLYVSQTREKGAYPIIITPVNRNYPWMEGQLVSCHGEYPEAAKSVARELSVPLIDLTDLSTRFFTKKGEEYVTSNYFMNLPVGKYTAYPDGMNDNTHFQPEGAQEVARLVFEAFVQIKELN